MRKVVVGLLLMLLTAGIACLFWYDDWRYKLPTPVPASYRAVPLGSPIDLAGRMPMTGDRPVFLHFFNPRCPCSRFNVPQFRALVNAYSDQVDFGVVVLSTEKYSVAEIQDQVGVDVPVSFDRSLAEACGVYSTPQAVLMDAGRGLYYRGNYNKSRYCADKATEFARMAIDSLLNARAGPGLGPSAFLSYGCELPDCKK